MSYNWSGRVLILASGLALTTLPANAAPHWDGFYVGALMGFEHQDAEFINTILGNPLNQGVINLNSARLGANVGFNFLSTGSLLFGVEADAVTHLDQRQGTNFGANYAQSSDWMATLRARAGFITDNVLVYATVGYGWDQIKAEHQQGFVAADDVVGGLVLGGGFETFISDHWSIQVQYTHASYDDTAAKVPFGAPVFLKDPGSDAVDVSFRWHLGSN